MPTIEERYHTIKRALFDKVYASLNDRQREAVYTVDGPLLVLAGAGSGKTTVLVRRIAFLIRYGNAYYDTTAPIGLDEERLLMLEGMLSRPAEEIEPMLSMFSKDAAQPYRILAITFTNKAANEIKTRIAAMFPDDEETAGEIWSGTFHSVCVRILRRHGELVGYRPGFTIYDTDDSKKAGAEAMKRLGIDEKLLPVKSVMNSISRAKDRLLSPEDFAMEAGQDYRQKQIASIYQEYQSILRQSNALDFDDIILQTVRLLTEQESVRRAYQERFRYVCVDEFQDTNVAQMRLTQLLSAGHRNLMVVGDDDQSIYRFRGATVENILAFDKSFPDARVIKLEQNYRSTQTILDAANAVIAHNSHRHGKALWTSAGAGAKIHRKECEDQNAEARWLVSRVNAMVAAGQASYRDFAVLYRTNAQAQSIEKAFARSAVPYRVLGGTRFTDRKEIRDAVAYLQLINNHDDDGRLHRIINEPRRKIGEKTLGAIAQIAQEQGCSQFSVIENADRYVALERSRATLLQFAGLIRELTALAEEVSLDVLFDAMLDRSGYRQMLRDMGPSEAERLENLEEFKSGILEYLRENEQPTLTGFLEETALVADVDRYDESADAVVMMTIHSAKGLEFPVVFLPGMEDGLFPGMQTITAGDVEMEEERRLAYVAITRAKRELFFLHTRTRLLYGQTTYNPLSRFVSEIPASLIEIEEPEENPYTRPVNRSVYGYRGAEAPAAQRRTYVADGVAYDRPRGASSVAPRRTPLGETTSVSRASRPTGAREPFSPGDRVRHATFGEGEILSVRPMGADLLYEIVFERVGTKKLMATYARLTKA